MDKERALREFQRRGRISAKHGEAVLGHRIEKRWEGPRVRQAKDELDQVPVELERLGAIAVLGERRRESDRVVGGQRFKAHRTKRYRPPTATLAVH